MAAHNRFQRARRVIDDAIAARVFPCASIEVGRLAGSILNYAAGRLTYDDDAPTANPDTIFDLASLTKVLATTSVALVQAHDGCLSIHRKVGEMTPQWSGLERKEVTLRDLLEHSSGLPEHRKYFLSIAGRAAFERAICNEPLVYPPRTRSLYSDPGFMLLGFLLEEGRKPSLDHQFDEWKTRARVIEPIAFHPPARWRARIAPTEVDPWRGRLLVGEVHDENAAALGGVAAHAGLFGTAAATGECARWWMAILSQWDEAPLFVQRSSVPGSSRALGWDTMLPTSSCGTRMSPRAFGHTGFTGTSLWIDPAHDLYVVLLTNRVHPTRHAEGIQPVRRAFHDAVMSDLEDGT